MTVPLRAVPDTGELPHDGPQTLGEALSLISDLEDMVRGQEATIKSQAARIGRLEREREQLDNPAAHHPRGAEIADLIERWKRGANHPKAAIGKARTKLVVARMKEYPLSADEWLPEGPTLELAVDGLCAFPHRRFDDRFREPQKGSKRDDDFSVALKDEKHVEHLSRLGYRARKNGWVTWHKEAK